jgi:predicted RNA-binding protein YlxR (DUF448 family)
VVSAHSLQRTCAGCGEAFDRSQLVRLALSPDKTVVLDYLQRLPGRGAWLFPCRECFARAASGKGLSRAFKESGVRMDADSLFELLKDSNRRRFLETIHLARKAGVLIAGGNNLEAAMKHEPVRLVLITEDASDNTVDRFTSKAAARNIPVLRALTKSELGESLGRDIQAVLGVTMDAFAEKMQREGAVYDAVMNRTACKKMR